MPSSLSGRSVPEDLFPRVYGRIEAALAELDSVREITDAARRLIAMLPEEPAMLSVPMLVFAVETGNLEPAVPVSAIHVLWWTAAHVLDDCIDKADISRWTGLSSGEALMAAVVCGISLPASIAVADFRATLLPDMIREFSDAWLVSNNGQVRDLGSAPGTTGGKEILKTYLHKTGAAYGAVSAMAARLAGRADRRCAQWRDFGRTLGLLGQFHNDQEDLASGRDEDLKNSTATFLLSCLLESRSAPDRRRVLDLLRRARDSAEVRAELREAMLSPDVVDAYLRQVEFLRCSALRKLGLLAAGGPHEHRLRQFVEDAATPLPLFANVALGTRVGWTRSYEGQT